MSNFLKLTEQDCKKVEKLLIESGIPYQVVDLSEEVAVREVNYYFENFPKEIDKLFPKVIDELHEEALPEIDIEEFKSIFRKEMTQSILNHFLLWVKRGRQNNTQPQQ